MGKIKNSIKKLKGSGVDIKWMLSHAKSIKGGITLILLFNIISLVISLASTIVGKYVVDFATGTRFSVEYMLIMAGASISAIIISSLAKLFNDYINEKFSFGMRVHIFDRIQRSTWQNVSKFHSGDMLTRLTTDIGTVSSGIISLIPSIILIVLQLTFSFCILFYYDRPLAIFALILGPIGASFALIFRRKFKKLQKEIRESESEYRSYMQEALTNIIVTKTFQCEDNNIEAINKIRDKRLKVIMSGSKMTTLMNLLMRSVYSAGYILAFCWGAYRLSKGTVTYGTLTVFITLVSQVQGSVSNLAHTIPQIYTMLISSSRIRDISAMESDEYSDRTDVPDKVGINIKNVSFTYDDDIILSDINVNIKSGERVGIVGSSGAGKTTLIRLLLSLVKTDKGSIEYVFGDNCKEKAAPSARRFISYVPQGNTVLSGTIRSNLLTGKEDASDEELWNSLRMSDAYDFVKKLPLGLDTPLGENAGGLSEGQAQRISIARAFIRNRPLLILDEATSALDEDTESRVLERITSKTDKTCLIITHRRSMLKYCDKVIEIDDNGKISVR